MSSRTRILTVLASSLIGAGLLTACGGGSHGHITKHSAVPTVSATVTRPAPSTSPTATPRPSTPPATPKPPVISLQQKNANGAAADYLDSQGFSRKGLIDQLKYDGFSTAEATKAVEAQHADWNAQAVRTAQDYLRTSHFSHKELIGQLEYDGYTSSQAAYGVKGAGL